MPLPLLAPHRTLHATNTPTATSASLLHHCSGVNTTPLVMTPLSSPYQQIRISMLPHQGRHRSSFFMARYTSTTPTHSQPSTTSFSSFALSSSSSSSSYPSTYSVAATMEAAADFLVELKQCATPGYQPMRRREDSLRAARSLQNQAVEAAQGLKDLVQNVRGQGYGWGRGC